MADIRISHPKLHTTTGQRALISYFVNPAMDSICGVNLRWWWAVIR